MNFLYKILILISVMISLISCQKKNDIDAEIIAINNEFIENNIQQKYDVLMLELSSLKDLNSINNILNNIEEKFNQGENITNRLDSLILEWQSNFDKEYSIEYFKRVDRNFTLFKSLNNKKDSNQLKNLFYMIKYEMINRYLVDIDGPCYTPFNHKVVTIVEPSNIAKVGEQVNLNIFYGALDSLMVYNIYIGGYHNNEFRSDLIVDTVVVDNGVGNYIITPKRVGDTLIEGVIMMNTPRGPVHYPFSKTITVYE